MELIDVVVGSAVEVKLDFEYICCCFEQELVYIYSLDKIFGIKL